MTKEVSDLSLFQLRDIVKRLSLSHPDIYRELASQTTRSATAPPSRSYTPPPRSSLRSRSPMLRSTKSSPTKKSSETPSPPKTSTTKSPKASPPKPTGSSGSATNTESEVGCYLVYDSGSSGKLMLHYSKVAVPHAAGFWSPGPGQKIQGFKFKQNLGRSELIGNCAAGVAGRKNYYSGWCQFVRAARALGGCVVIISHGDDEEEDGDENEFMYGLPVDIHVYYEEVRDGCNSHKLEVNKPFDVSEIDAVACVPKHSDAFEGLSKVDMTIWAQLANSVGATGTFE